MTEQETQAAEAKLLELWERARRMALRRCGRSFARLSMGEGGFYEPEDFLQDLFLEFWAIVRRNGGRDDSELWEEWARVLWGGGLRVLRRKPQRLWQRPEVVLPAQVFELADPESDDDLGSLAGGELPQRARQTLSTEGLLADSEGADLLDNLEESLWRLTPGQRQVLYLLAVRGLGAEEIAERLLLGSRGAVYKRAQRARRSLRRRPKVAKGAHRARKSD